MDWIDNMLRFYRMSGGVGGEHVCIRNVIDIEEIVRQMSPSHEVLYQSSGLQQPKCITAYV